MQHSITTFENSKVTRMIAVVQIYIVGKQTPHPNGRTSKITFTRGMGIRKEIAMAIFTKIFHNFPHKLNLDKFMTNADDNSADKDFREVKEEGDPVVYTTTLGFSCVT